MNTFTRHIALLLALGVGLELAAQTDDYWKAVKALKPDHYYRLDESLLGEPRFDDEGNLVPVGEAGGVEYESPVTDVGDAETLIDGFHEGMFEPLEVNPPFATVGVQGPGPGLCGLEETNLAFSANNAGSINLGPNEAFAHEVMTVAMWFTNGGSEGGDRIWTNNRPDRSDHFQITLGGSASLVIGIDPTSETIADALQVPESAIRVKDGQWHHIVASRNGPTMGGVLVVIDGVDYTGNLVDSTTGWGRTGDNAHIASRPGGDGGPNRQTLNGSVDEVSVWLGRQLTVGEAVDLYNAAIGCIPTAKVARDNTPDAYRTGESIDVSLKVTVEGAPVDLTLEEILPPDAVPSDISAGGTVVDRTIQWSLAGASTSTLTYRLTPPSCAGDLAWGVSSFMEGTAKGRVTGESVASRGVSQEDLGAWESLDIDTTGRGGELLGDHDLFLEGSGNGVRLTSDEFRFVHLPRSGDFEITARLDCLDSPGGTGQAGLMVRDNLDTFSANAYFYAGPAAGGGATLKGSFRRETLVSRSTTSIAISDREVPSFPVYLKLARKEGKISFQRSADGQTYNEVASRDIGVGTTLVDLRNETLAGLAVSGGGPTTARAMFREVSGAGFREAPGPTFRRGDSNSSGGLDLTDAIKLLNYLFLGQEKPECLDAADFDDTGEADISDAIANLNFQFLGGPGPAEPLACGRDPNEEALDLGCERGCA